jgi:hypothetical protein
MRKIGLETGWATEDDLEEMASAWEQWCGSDDPTLGMLHGEILIQK